MSAITNSELQVILREMIDPEIYLEDDQLNTNVVLPNGGGTVKGIFDNRPAEAFGDIRLSAPKVTLATAVAQSLNDGDQLIIKNKRASG